MSDHFVHTHNACGGNSGQSMHSYHAAWMSHWTRRSYEETIPNHNFSFSSFRNNESCHASNEYRLTSGKEIVSNICRPDKGLGEIKTGCLKLENEGLKMTSPITGMEIRKLESLPTDGPCKNSESTSNRKDSQAASDIEALRVHQMKHDLDFGSTTLSLRCYVPPLPSVSLDADRTPSKVCHFETEGMLHNTKEHMETYSFFGDSNFAMPQPLSKNLNKSSANMVECGHGHGNERISFLPSLMGSSAPASEEQLPLTNPNFVESGNLDFQRKSTFVVCEQKIESHSKARTSLTPYQQQNKASSSETDPSKINNHLLASGQEQFQETQNASGISILQSQSTHPEDGCSSLHKFPHSLHDMESMRICATVDSVVPLRGGHPRFSQTTHSLLIAKRTDLNSCKEKTSFRNFRESAESNGNTFIKLWSLSPPFGTGSKGVKIQSSGSSTDSEGKKNIGDPLGRDAKDVMAFDNSLNIRGKKVQDNPDQKNESSAETDTMDLDDFKEKNQAISVNSSPSSKTLKLSFVKPEPTIGFTREHRQHELKIPVINLEFPALPASNNIDPSSSRTQSLDMETFLAHSEQLSHSKSDWSLKGSATPEPSSRWIKRLKLSVSEPSAFGTKSSNGEERSCHEKKSPGKNPKGCMASSEPTVSKLQHGKELVIFNKTAASLRCGESSSMDTTEKGRCSLTSQSWIRRWCHNQSAAPQKKSGTVVVCEPGSSKLAFEGLQDKQLPSIAAMALMGKAMNSFQTCEFERRGSVIVWNTKGF